MKPKTAVVILNYNGKHFLELFLQTVIEFSTEAQVIVADNNSTDDSVSFIKSNFPDIELIILKKNYGYAGGYNETLKKVDAEYYILLNSDVKVTKNWIAPIIDFLDQNPLYAAAQPKILDYNKPDHFEYAGASGGFIDSLGYPYCRGRIFDTIEKNHNQYDEPIDIFWASGACLFIRSEVFHSHNGFDDSFFAHMEEIDLAWRVHASGLKIICLPDSEVFHVGGGTLNKQSAFKTYLNFRNNLYMLLKNLPANNLNKVIIIRIFLDWAYALSMIFRGSYNHTLAIFRAYSYILKNSNRIKRERKNTIYPLGKGRIIISYFIKNKKKYSSIVP